MLMKTREETKYIVVMSTGSFPEDNETAETARMKDIKKGFLDSCFHYFIETDGSVGTGRELDHYSAGLKRHNKHSVIIKWSGGKDKRLKKRVDNQTEAQKAVVPDIIDELKELYPRAQVVTFDELINLK